MNLLIVNKDINATNLLRFHLEKNNFTITHTEIYENIVEINQKHFFDVIVADFDQNNKFEENIFQKLKEINPEIIIILTVEFGNVDNAIKACKSGADDYITRPFGTEYLMFTIEKVIRTKELIKENEILQKKLNNKNHIN